MGNELQPQDDKMKIEISIQDRLCELEKTYVLGQQALKERNQLVCELVANGAKQADVFRLLNQSRVEAGGTPLTRDAVFMVVRRGKTANFEYKTPGK
jgi:hypothetical protein